MTFTGFGNSAVVNGVDPRSHGHNRARLDGGLAVYHWAEGD